MLWDNNIRSLFAILSRVRSGQGDGLPVGLPRFGINNDKKTGAQRTSWPDPVLAKALQPLERLVVMRYWLESLRLILLWGLAAVGTVLALLWLYPAVPPWAAFPAGCAAALVIACIRLYRRPDALTVVRIADLLALDGDAVTAYRVLESGAADNWSRAAAEKGIAVCVAMGADWPVLYRVVPGWFNWRGVALLAGVVLALQLVPNPLAPYWAQKQAEQEVLAAAAVQARHLVGEVKNLTIQGEKVLPEAVRENLAELPGEVKGAGDRRQAADKLEKASWELQEAHSVISPAAARDIDRLAEMWGGRQEKVWQDLAAALEEREESGIDQAVRALNEKLSVAGESDRKKMAAALFESAGAVQNPSLRQALRDTADAAVAEDNRPVGEGSGNDKSDTISPGSSASSGVSSAAANALAGALANLAGTAAAGSALGSASTGLAGLASGLAGGGADAPYGLAAGNGGSSGGNGSGNSFGDAGGSGPGGIGAGGSGGVAEGSDAPDSGNGGHAGAGSSDSQGGGNGSSGNSGGSGSGGAGAGLGGGGLEMVYTPFLPDNGVEQSQVSGQLRQGEQGSEITLDSPSPTTLGALRPYNEVYGRYMTEAHDSLSRAPLPPDMEKLVWQYFSVLGEGGGGDKQ